MQETFTALAVSEADTLGQIRDTYRETGYILDPHTAVGVKAAQAFPEAICLATAHPAKFGAAVREAIGKEAAPPPCLQDLMSKPTRCAELDADSATVRRYVQDTLADRAEASP